MGKGEGGGGALSAAELKIVQDAKRAKEEAEEQARATAEMAAIQEEKDQMKAEDALSFAVVVMERLNACSLRATNVLKKRIVEAKTRRRAIDKISHRFGAHKTYGRFLEAEVNAISPTYLKTLRGHTAAVIDLSLSEDGRHAISCSEDQTIRMWDIRRGKCIKVFTGMGSSCRACSLSLMNIWEKRRSTSKPARNAQAKDAVFAGARDGSVKKWTFDHVHSSAKRRGAAKESSKDLLKKISDLSSPTSTSRRSGAAFSVTSADKANAKEEQFSEDGFFEGHKLGVTSVALSPSKDLLATSSVDRTVALWSAHTGKLLYSFYGHLDTVSCCAFSPDGTNIVSCGAGSDCSVKLWKTNAYRRGLRIKQKKNALKVVFRTVNRGLYRGRAVSGGWRRVKVKPSTMKQKVRNIETAARHAVAAMYDEAPGASILPADYKDIDRGRKTAYLDLPGLSDKGIRDEKGRRFAVDPIPGFNSLVDDALKLSWDNFAVDEELLARRGGLIRTFERKQSGSRNLGHTESVQHCEYSHNGLRIITCGNDRLIKLWDPVDGRLARELAGHTAEVLCASFSFDDQLVVSGSVDLLLIVRISGHEDVVYRCLFTPDGNVVSCSHDKKVMVWQLEEGVPAEPTNLEVVDVGKQYVSLKWEAPPAFGHPILGNRIEWSIDESEEFKSFVEIGVTTEWIVENLTAGKQYRFRVNAFSDLGQGHYSEETRLVRTHASEPSTIERPVAMEIDTGSISIHWVLPPSMGAHVKEFYIQYRGGTGPRDFGNENTKIIKFTEAKDAFQSYCSRTVAKYEQELKLLRAVKSMSQQKKAHMKFLRQKRKREHKKALRYMEQKGADGTQLVRLSTTISGLEPGMMYQFRVAAANRVGRGEYSDPSASAYTAPREPEKPMPPKVSNISLTRYVIFCSNGTKISVASNHQFVVYDKLLPGQEYSFSVLAWNGVGRGPVSDQSEIFKTMTSVPEPPETPECSGPTQTAMTLSWTEPYDNGEPIVGYIIARRAGSIGDFGHEVYQTKEQLWSMWSQWEAYETAAQEDKGETALEIDDTKVESSADGRGKAAKMTTNITDGTTVRREGLGSKWNFRVTDLVARNLYQFKVAAVNKNGRGPLSDENKPFASLDAEPPHAPPTAPAVGAVRPGVVTLSWNVPYDCGSYINGYVVKWKESDTQVKEWLGEMHVKKTAFKECVVEDLEPSKDYIFKVAAVNELGVGMYSRETAVIHVPSQIEYLLEQAREKDIKLDI